MSDKLMTVREVAERLAIAEPTVYRQLADGKIPGKIKVGQCVRVSRRAFESWLERLVEQAATAP